MVSKESIQDKEHRTTNFKVLHGRTVKFLLIKPGSMKVDKAVKMAFSNFFFSKLWNPEFYSRSRLNRFRSKSSKFEKENSKKNRKSSINNFIPYMTSCKEASHSLDLIQFKKGWKISCGRGTKSWTVIDFHCFKTSFFEKRKPFLEKEKERFFPIIEFEKRTKLYVFLGSSILKRNFCPFALLLTVYILGQ